MFETIKNFFTGPSYPEDKILKELLQQDLFWDYADGPFDYSATWKSPDSNSEYEVCLARETVKKRGILDKDEEEIYIVIQEIMDLKNLSPRTRLAFHSKSSYAFTLFNKVTQEFVDAEEKENQREIEKVYQSLIENGRRSVVNTKGI